MERTNNLLESFFRGMKHAERRRSGRKILTQDFEHLPPEVALVNNLNHPDYVEILCGSLDNLAGAFADLNAEKRTTNSSGISKDSALLPDVPEIASASLPSEDLRIIRSEDMRRRVLSAAKSRAPRKPVRRPVRRKATVK